jgi:hypothetical protein
MKDKNFVKIVYWEKFSVSIVSPKLNISCDPKIALVHCYYFDSIISCDFRNSRLLSDRRKVLE